MKQKTRVKKLDQSVLDQLFDSVYQYRHKLVPFKKVAIKKIKSFSIYRLISERGSVFKQFKKVRWPEFMSYFNLGTRTNNNRIVGVTPTYIGFRPSKPINQNTIINSAISDLITEGNIPKEIYTELSKAVLKDRIVYTGSPDSNVLHLKEFLKPNKTDNDKGFLSTKQILEISLKARDWFLHGNYKFSDPMEMYHCTNFNPNSYPGYMTETLLGTDKKGLSNQISVKLALKHFNTIRKIPMMNLSLWSLFSREKEIKTTKELSEVTTRVVMCTEEFLSHLYGWVFQKVVKNTPNTKINIDGEFNGKKGLNLYKKSEGFDYMLEADWSFFDSTIDTNYLVAACILMFSENITTKEDMRFIFHIICSVCFKNLIVPPGVIIELTRGNASGHPGVTAVNCYVNLIRWSIIGYSIYGDSFRDYMDIEVYGDDAIVYFKSHPNIKNLDDICKLYGFKSDPLLPNLIPTAILDLSDAKKPDFLKRYFSLKGIEWNLEKVFTKMVYQSRNRTNLEQIELLSNYVFTGPMNPKFNELIKKIIIKCSILDPDIKNRANELISLIDNLDYSRFYPGVVNDTIDGFNFNKKVDSFSIGLYIPRLSSKYWTQQSVNRVAQLYFAVNSSGFLNKVLNTRYKKWLEYINDFDDINFDFDFFESRITNMVRVVKIN